MIEGNNTNELQGQLDLTDVMGEGTGNREQGTGMAEGYDAEGHLMDYVPGGGTTSSAPDGAPSPEGEGKETTDAEPAEGIPYAPPAILDAPQTQKPPLKGEGDRAAVEGSISTASSSGTPDRLTALAVEINAITEQTRGVVISFALAVGKRLIEAKSLCPEGRWTEWLAKSVNYSERKAQDMMRLYSEYGRDGQIPDSIAALDYSKAVALLSAPAEAREELAVKAEAEDLSVRQLQDEIKMLKAERIRAQQRMDFIDRQNGQAKSNIAQLEAQTQAQSAAINAKDREIREFMRQMDEYDRTIEKLDRELQASKSVTASAAEKIAAANAKADAAESAAAELRKLHSDAEDRAAANAQRASDAVNRANQTAKDLAEARAEIAKLREQGTGNREQEMPEERIVEVIPEAVTRELETLRAQLAEAKANQGTTSPAPDGAPSPKGEGYEASAVEKFKWFYANQMKPAFTTALTLLREVAKEDGGAADAYATALTKACQMLMNQLGTK